MFDRCFPFRIASIKWIKENLGKMHSDGSIKGNWFITQGDNRVLLYAFRYTEDAFWYWIVWA